MTLTTLQLGKIRYNVRGEWSAATSYIVDDIVTLFGSSYISILAGTNQNPITNTSYWKQLSSMPTDKGEWSSSTTYYLNNIVTVTESNIFDQYYNWENRKTYICIIASSNNQSPSSTPGSWTKISSGTFNNRFAFLGAANDGYVPDYRLLWNAKSGATTGTIGIVTITSSGSGYTTNRGTPAGLSTASVTFSGGAGVGASAVAYVSAGGTIFDINITNPGSGYSNPITVTISGGGSPSATATATSYVYTTRVGMGDTFGQFKGPWHSGFGVGGEGWLKYINRNYGLIQLGYQNSTYCTGGNASQNEKLITPSEAAFIHLDWLEGVLPTPDGLPPKVIQVEASLYNSLVLFNNGEVHYAGYNGSGQAGDNTTTNAVSYVRCGYSRTNKSGTSILRGKRAIRIASSCGGDGNGSAANYALIENLNGTRSIFAWGYNGYGQLGDGTTTSRSAPVLVNIGQLSGKITEIWATGGDYGQLFVMTDLGNMYSCGYNGYGQLGINNTSTQSTLWLVKAWGTGSSRVKKFICGGGNTASHMFVLQENGSLWSWGYNGNGQLGHNHTNNIYTPIVVYASGYTGSNGANVVGTPSGSAVVAFDVWASGPNNPASTYFASGTVVTNTTAFACGYNGYYNLSDNTSTQRNVFTNMLMSVAGTNSTNLTNTTEILGNSSSGNYNGLMVKRYNDEWFLGGYNNGTGGVGHADAFNIRQIQDPNYVANNYRVKSNILWPQAFNQNFVKFISRSANTSSGQWVFVYLKTGQLFVSNSDNTYGVYGNTTTASYKFHRLIGH